VTLITVDLVPHLGDHARVRGPARHPAPVPQIVHVAIATTVTVRTARQPRPIHMSVDASAVSTAPPGSMKMKTMSKLPRISPVTSQPIRTSNAASGIETATERSIVLHAHIVNPVVAGVDIGRDRDLGLDPLNTRTTQKKSPRVPSLRP
jgi:hypothetical protein